MEVLNCRQTLAGQRVRVFQLFVQGVVFSRQFGDLRFLQDDCPSHIRIAGIIGCQRGDIFLLPASEFDLGVQPLLKLCLGGKRFIQIFLQLSNLLTFRPFILRGILPTLRVGRDAIRQSGPLFFRSLQLTLQFVVFAFQRQQFFIQRNSFGASDLQVFRQFAAFRFLGAFFLQLFQGGLPFLQRLFKIGSVFLGCSQSRL